MWGANVTPIPTSSKEESDLLVEYPGLRLLVEEKTKLEDPARERARNETLAQGHVHGSTQPLRHNNRLSAIVGKASKQLSSTGAEVDHDLRLIWFTGVGFDGEAKHYQFMSTLYGSTRVFQLHEETMRTCYFFRNSDFFRYREQIDGAVASYLTGSSLTVKLCLNPYSAQWRKLRDSPFASNFKVGLVDPMAEEARGGAYIADTDIQRADESAVLHYVEQKYGLTMAQHMDLGLTSAVVRDQE